MINIYNILITVIALIYITILYTSVGLSLGYLMDKYVLDYINKEIDEHSKKKKINYFKKYIKLIISLCLLTMVSYVVIVTLEEIPFPFNGEYGFDINHLKLFYQRDLIFLILVGLSPHIIHNIELLKKN